MEFVLANTVTHFDYDGRFSQNNKDWAKGIVAENEWQNNDLILSSHPAVLDGFTNQARRYINVLREKEKEAQQKSRLMDMSVFWLMSGAVKREIPAWK